MHHNIIISAKNQCSCCCLLQSNTEREWLLRRYEEHRHTDFGAERKKTMAEQLIKCQAFDRFLAKKFGTVKRYGAEGAESMITFFDEVLSKCGKGKLLGYALWIGKLEIIVPLWKLKKVDIINLSF